MKAYGGVQLWVQLFLTSTQGGGEWWALRPQPLYPREKSPVLTEHETW
jgi:hypothetical protein